jgi:hypothetical protein
MTTNTTQVSSDQQTDSVSQDYGFNVGSFSDQYKNVNLVLQTLQWIKEDEQKLVNPSLSVFEKQALYQDLSNFFKGVGKYSAFAHSSADASMRDTVRSAVNKSLQQFSDITIPVPSDRSQHSSTVQIMYNGRPATLADIILNWGSGDQCFSFTLKKNILHDDPDHNKKWANQCQWEKDFGSMGDFAENKGSVGYYDPFQWSSGGDPHKPENHNGIKVSASVDHVKPCHSHQFDTIKVEMSASTLAKYMTVQPPATAYPGASLTAPLDNALFDLGL